MFCIIDEIVMSPAGRNITKSRQGQHEEALRHMIEFWERAL